jgi:hypothetical protein
MFDNGVLLAGLSVLGVLGVKAVAGAVSGSSDSTEDTRWWGSYDEVAQQGGFAARRRNSKGHFVSGSRWF